MDLDGDTEVDIDGPSMRGLLSGEMAERQQPSTEQGSTQVVRNPGAQVSGRTKPAGAAGLPNSNRNPAREMAGAPPAV